MQEIDYFICPCCGNKIEREPTHIMPICTKCLYVIPVHGIPAVYCSHCFSPVMVYSSVDYCCSNPDCLHFHIECASLGVSDSLETNPSILLYWGNRLVFRYSPAWDSTSIKVEEFPYLYKFFKKVLNKFGYSLERS